MPAQYVIGIDLGTTNTAVAYVDLNGAKVKGRRVIEAFDVPQLVAPGEVQGREGLPSFLYLLGGYDLPEGSTALPWDLERTHAVGELAREQGAKVPGRLVASAKSWLSHDGVDRTADLLPWGASKDVDQVSPVEASRRYLQHLREAWDHTMPAPFRDQIVILTVPASFDEVARELTVTAARRAGLDKVILLEEPLAAFYAWMSGDTRAQ
ncbi:MAG: Hsp70 family protein, partial [Bacteroidota bacterium]